jgi:hypothetical protein
MYTNIILIMVYIYEYLIFIAQFTPGSAQVHRYFKKDDQQLQYYQQITREQIPVTSHFAATKMPSFVLATSNCTPPTRMVTTDTSVVQLVTPEAGDVVYALRYTPDKLWVRCSQAPPSNAERTQLNRARIDAIKDSDGVYTRCDVDYTSELTTLNTGFVHKPTTQWVDTRVELKALKKRLPLLEKAKYSFKPLENAIDGLECTHRLREDTDCMAGLPFIDEQVQAVQLHLPALIALGEAKKRKDMLKRLISIRLSDMIAHANANPYSGPRKTVNRGLIKQYKSRIDLLERFYEHFAKERNLPSEEQIRLRRIICLDDVQNPWKAIEAKCQRHEKIRKPMKSVTPEQMDKVSKARVDELKNQQNTGAYNQGLYGLCTGLWGHLMCRRAVEWQLSQGDPPAFENKIMGETQLLKQTAKKAEKLKSSKAKGAIKIKPLPSKNSKHSHRIGYEFQPTPYTDGFPALLKKVFPTLEMFENALDQCGGLDIAKIKEKRTADKKSSTLYDNSCNGNSLNCARYLEYFASDMKVSNPREYNTFLVTRGANYVTAIVDWKIALHVNANDASMYTARSEAEKEASEDQFIAGPLTVSLLDGIWIGMQQNKKARKKRWAMDYLVCLNFLCSEWFGSRTHMAEELFACSKAEWELRDPDDIHGTYVRGGIWFVREKHSDNTVSWFVHILFTKQERKKYDFNQTAKSKDPTRITLCIHNQWQELAIKDCLGIVKVLELLPQAFRAYFGYPIGQEERNYSSNIEPSRGSKVLLCHALPNPDFPVKSKQFIQYDCDPHKQDCYINNDNEYVLEQVGFKGVRPSAATLETMSSLEYEVNGEKKTGVTLMKHPPSARALHGVLKSWGGSGVEKLTKHAIDLVKEAKISPKDAHLSTGKRFTSEEVIGLEILANELGSYRGGVKLNYRWFRRKKFAAKLLFMKKLAVRELGEEHKFTKWVVQKYRRCIKEESHESDRVIDTHYNEELTQFGLPQYGLILNSGSGTLKLESGCLVGHLTAMVTPGTYTLEQSPGDFSKTELVAKMNCNVAYISAKNEFMVKTGPLEYEIKKNRHEALDYFADYIIQPIVANKPVGTFNAFDIWRQSSYRLKYNKKVCNPRSMDHPDAAKSNEFNVFKGFAIVYDDVKNDEGDPTPFVDHITHIWCRNDEKAAKCVIQFFAQMLQTPWVRVDWGLYLRGEQGSMKNFVLDQWIKIILGPDACFVTHDAEKIFGKFNKHLEGKILIGNDEAVSTFDKKAMSQLKGFTTSTTMMVEDKGKSTYEVEALHRLITFSNDAQYANVGVGQRRGFFLETDDMYAEVNCPDGSEAAQRRQAHIERCLGCSPQTVAKFLYEYDISGFNARRVIHTKYEQAQIEGI